jgi:glyoxylase-like metal-dependent hydrolase (beta-lactamase superfamily II)
VVFGNEVLVEHGDGCHHGSEFIETPGGTGLHILLDAREAYNPPYPFDVACVLRKLSDLTEGGRVEDIFGFHHHPDYFVGAEYLFELIVARCFRKVLDYEIVNRGANGELGYEPGEKQRNHCHSQDNPLRAVDYGLEYFSLRQASKELF